MDTNFGPRQRTMLEEITDILNEYPDGSNILKELIQNADDADATDIAFLLDPTNHPIAHLALSDLSEYQGPALYSWNDSMFTEKDWEGIQRIGRSVKETTVLKVGRFGLGFVSVYHLTDTPTILSDKLLGINHPLRELSHPGSRGVSFSIEQLATNPSFSGHLPCFEGYFGYARGSSYKGTVIRLPLRKTNSAISGSVSDVRAVREKLLLPLMEEAEYTLLFLKSVSSIEILERVEHDTQSLFRAEIPRDYRHIVRKYRKDVTEFVSSREYLTRTRLFVCLFPTISSRGGNGEKREKVWLVLNLIGFGSQNGELRTFYCEQNLNYLPWVGLGLATGVRDLSRCNSWCFEWNDGNPSMLFESIKATFSNPFIVDPETELEISTGRLFCFLPTQLESKFPFHVHSYFSLSSNRRSVNWPAPDNQNDIGPKWNQLLTQNLTSVAYAAFLHIAIIALEHPSPLMYHYKLLSRWSPHEPEHTLFSSILCRGLRKLSKHLLFFSRQGGGKWLSINEAIFLPSLAGKSLSHEDVCLKLFELLEQPIVDIPPFISEIILNIPEIFSQIKERILTPVGIRNLLVEFYNSPVCREYIASESVCIALLDILLTYVSTLESNQLFLDGVPLLPISGSNQPHLFRYNGDTMHFISDNTPTHLTLFPGLENSFVNHSIPQRLHSILLSLAGRGTSLNLFDLTNLEKNPELFSRLLTESLSCLFRAESLDSITWRPGVDNQPPASWIIRLYHFIGASQSLLSAVSRLPILPQHSTARDVITLIPLQSQCIYIEICDNANLKWLEQILELSGCYLCVNQPFIECFRKFVLPPIPAGLIQALCSTQILNNFLSKLPRGEDEKMFQLIDMLIPFAEDSTFPIIKQLPVFPTTRGEWLALHSDIILPPLLIPSDILYPPHIISPFKSSVRILYEKLNIPPISIECFLKFHLLPFLVSPLDTNVRNKLIVFALENITKLDFDVCEVGACLENSEWIADATTSNCLHTPSSLLDPGDAVFEKLLLPHSKSLFPSDICQNHFDIMKRFLGMKSHDTLSLDLLVKVCQHSVEALKSKTGSGWRSTFNALLDLLSYYIDSFDTVSLRTLFGIFATQCIVLDQFPPKDWPLCVRFHTSNQLCCPQDVVLCQSDDIWLIGSICHTFSDSFSNAAQRTLIGMGMSSLSIEMVIRQLNYLTQTEMNDADGESVYRMVSKIYNYLNCHVPQVRDLESNIIFIREECKFVSTESVVFVTPFDLTPYLYSIQQLRYESTEFFHFLEINQSPSPTQLSLILCRFNELDDRLSDRQLKIVIDILKYFAERDVPLTELQIYIPGKDLRLYERGDVKLVFWDHCWLERGLIEEDFVIVHGTISNEMAYELGVSPFSERVAPPSEDFWCEESGQQVCVTDRLRSILEAYSGNINVLKEMLQNADDARATEMKVVFDWRKHPTQTLLNTELKDWQGPAILFYNNSTFSEKDFRNIMKIDGATKAEDGTTIGRYGLGFCTVYHFTDVPSFVSRNYVHIFDPQKKYLRRSKGGCKIDFCNGQYAKYIGLYRDQFAPYEGIFGCEIMNHNSFNGTLFRIPIRSSNISSDISLNRFEHSDIIHLQESFLREAEHLLFFTQCIKSIEIYDRSASSQAPELIHAVRRDEISQPPIPHSFLHTNICLVKLLYEGQPMTPAVSHCEYKLIVKSRQSMDWMVTYATGSGACVEVLRNLPYNVAPLPFAGVAINLDLLRRVDQSDYQSTLYCFFPLPISTSFPFHCHAMFELRHDRQGLVDSVETKTEWNKALVSDALVLATLTLYQRLAEKVKLSNDRTSRHAYINILYKMFAREVLNDPLWAGFAVAISKQFSQSDFELFPLTRTTGIDWGSFSSTYFLEISSIKSDLRELWSDSFSSNVHGAVVSCGYPVAIIPDSICENSALISLLFRSRTDNIIDLKMFTNIFFSNLSKFSIDLIVDILTVLISACTVHIWLRDAIMSTPCIPCGEVGTFLKPNKVVDPNSHLVAQLYERIENRLPRDACIEAMFTSGPVLNVLRTNLDLITFKLSNEELKGRAEYIKANSNRELAVRLIGYLDQKIFTGSEVEAMRSVICNVAFIPVECPNITETFSITSNFCSPSEIIPFSLKPIVELQLPVCPENLMRYQDFISNFILSNDYNLPRSIALIAIDELKLCIQHYGTLVPVMDIPDKVTKIYESIGEHCLAAEYSEVPNNGILIPSVGFCDRARLLLDSNEDFPPYIFSLSSYYTRRSKFLHDFFVKMGVNETLSHHQCMMVIEELYNRQGSTPLTPQEQQIVQKFIFHIYDSQTGSASNFLLCKDNIIHLAEDCIFYDLNWKGGESDVFYTHKDKTYYFIHDHFGNEVASRLGAKPLSHIKLSGCTSLPFTFSSRGQSEPLPRRIKNILSEYESDIDIFKELTQNADDAHATEIKFLFDYSHYGEEHIIHPEMKHWQGPALYCFNNATFSDADFENITKLAGRSKIGDQTTIGSYGIGFNTVYHLTDVPSFVSRRFVTLFDPQLLYLSGLVHPHSPGMQLDFMDEWENLKDFSDQFSVYNGIFGCDLSQREEYEGTLFRLPLRTPKITSELSQMQYNPNNSLKDLHDKMFAMAKELIIFLQSINSIELHVRRGLDQGIFLTHRVTKSRALNFIADNNIHLNSLLTGSSCTPVTNVSTIEITTQSHPHPEDSEEFIVSFSSGAKLCFDLMKRIKKDNQVCTLPVCSVAVPKCLLTLPIEEFESYKCHLFCFLPLPCLSQYPMHINGSFQLQQSRRALHCTSDGSIKTKWNQALIADALPIAVVNMLISLTGEFTSENNTPLTVDQLDRYYSFWPNSNKCDILWREFSLMTAKHIMRSNSEIFYCKTHPMHWVGFEDASLFVTDPSIYTLGSEFTDVLSHFASKNQIYFIDHPLNFVNQRIMSHLTFNETQRYRIDRACREILFPHLDELMASNPETVKLIIYTLLQNLKYEVCLKNLLTTEACIPCGEENPIFRPIPEVISPHSIFTQIFYPEDKRIPSSSFQSLFDIDLSPDTSQALISLGVITSELPLDLLVNRCNKTLELEEVQLADQHAKHLLDYINGMAPNSIANCMRNLLQDIPFIPVYQDKVYDALCPDEMCRFSSPSSCCVFEKKHLSPHYKPVTMVINSLHRAMSRLGIFDKEIPLQAVLDSIFLIQENLEKIEDIDISQIDETISAIYLFIAQSCFPRTSDPICEGNRDLVRTALAEKNWIFSVSRRKFYPLSQTIISNEYLHFNSQFINSFSSIQLLSSGCFKRFSVFMKIPTMVSPEMAHGIICSMQEHFGNTCLPSTADCNECEFVINLINTALKKLRVENYSDTIYLLTEHNQLQLASQLYLNDAPWLDNPDSENFVHHDITLFSSEKLGAKSRIESICVGIPIELEEFGQHEKISNRIDTLLREFPCDVTIFKELIQNAEDAEATEVGIVLDCQPYGEESLCLSSRQQKKWKELQRVPSLLIYNNRPFTEDDIKGIQAVGIGGKQGRNTIGRFGLGFNSVYHFTRVPCLLSCSEDGSDSNFCVFDPYREHLNLPRNSLPGLRVKIGTPNLEKFPHQFLPYFPEPLSTYMSNLKDRKCFSIFRLPLNRSPNIENNVCKTKKLLLDLIKEAPRLLPFITHVEDIRIFHIESDGTTTCRGIIKSKILFQPDFQVERPICGQDQSIKIITKTVFVDRPLDLDSKQIMSAPRPNEVTWLIYHYDGCVDTFCQESEILKNHVDTYNREKLRLFSSIAVETVSTESPTPTQKRYLYCHLPFGNSLDFPVHINCPFILDPHRRYVSYQDELTGSSSWDNIWHSEILKRVLTPLYFKLLIDLGPGGSREHSNLPDSEYFTWYYSLFPVIHHTDHGSNSMEFLQALGRNVLKCIYDDNSKILLADDIEITKTRMWYPVHGSEAGIFKVIQDGVFLNEYSKCAKCLVKLQFHFTFAPTSLANSFLACERECCLFNPQKVLVYINEHKDTLAKASHSFPCSLENSVLNFEELSTLLEFILKHSESDSIDCIPLKVDSNFNLGIFNHSKNSSFPDKYVSLLPNLKERFLCEEYDTRLLQILTRYNFIEYLNATFVADNLVVLDCVSPEFFSLFWAFICEIGSQHVSLFGRYRLVPVIHGASNQDDLKFLEISEIPGVATEKISSNLKCTLKKLECPFLSLSSPQMKNSSHSIRKLIESLAINECRAEVIIKCISLCNNIDVELSGEEASVLRDLFQNMYYHGFRYWGTFLRLKIFVACTAPAQTTLVALNGFKICLNGEDFPLTENLIRRLNESYKIIFLSNIYNSLTLIRGITEHSSLHFVDLENLVNSYILTDIIFSQLEPNAQIELIRFFNGLKNKNKNWMKPLSSLKFIKIQQHFYKPSDLFCPNVPLFAIYRINLLLPPCWLESTDIYYLIKHLGLKVEMSLDIILQSARDVANPCSNNLKLTRLTIEALKGYISDLYKEDINDDFYLRQLAKIPFLLVFKVGTLFSKERTYRLGCFNEAQLYEHYDYCCTECLIFNRNVCFSNPCKKRLARVMELLNLKANPPILSVKSHLENLIHICGSASQEEIRTHLVRLFMRTYGYLQSSPDPLTEFRDAKCILYDCELYKPINIVMNWKFNLSPYLFQCPETLEPYKKFLQKLCVCHAPSYKHFKFVLTAIQTNNGCNQLTQTSPDDTSRYSLAKSAFMYLIEELRSLENTDAVELGGMLLNTDKDVLIKYDSSDLFYADDTQLQNRVLAVFPNIQILALLNHDELGSSAPPACLQLKFLSNIFTQTLCSNVYSNNVTEDERAESFQTRLKSSQVHAALKRIYFHQTCKDLSKVKFQNRIAYFDTEEDQHPTEQGYLSIENKIGGLNIIPVSRIDIAVADTRDPAATQLMINKNCISFLDESNGNILINTDPSFSERLPVEMTYQLNQYFCNIFERSLFHLLICLVYLEDDINHTLNDFKVRQLPPNLD